MIAATKPTWDNWPVALSANTFSLNFPTSRYFSECAPIPSALDSSTFEGSTCTPGRTANSTSGAGLRPTLAFESEASAIVPKPSGEKRLVVELNVEISHGFGTINCAPTGVEASRRGPYGG